MSDAMKAGRPNCMCERQMTHGRKQRPNGEVWRYDAITADHTHEDESVAEYLE
jgi:hypothetical protein